MPALLRPLFCFFPHAIPCIFLGAVPLAAAPKIVGGTPAEPAGFSFMAALLTHGISDAFEAQNCAGSLVHPYWVVTAAHCVEGVFADELDVLIGTANLSNTSSAQRIRVAEIFIHPDYEDRDGALENDVALLLLSSPAAQGSLTLPLIEDPQLALPGINATAVGWGNTTSEGNPSTILRKVVLPILPTETVNQKDWLDNQVSSSMLAAGFASGGKDSCQGDSGGPLLVPGPDGSGWRLAGIVSWGDGCAEPNKPGVYARVSEFRQWLQQHLWPGFAQWERSFGIATGDPPDIDRDGLSQWMEYALQTHPRISSGSGLPIPGSISSGGLSYPASTFRRRSTPSDTILSVLQSPSLATWSPVAASFQEGQALPDPDSPDMETVTFRSPFSFSQQPRQFLRLQSTPSLLYSSPARTLADGRPVLGRLNTFDPLLNNRYYKEYLLTGHTQGSAVPILPKARIFSQCSPSSKPVTDPWQARLLLREMPPPSSLPQKPAVST